MPGLLLGLLDGHAREQRRQRRDLLRELAAFDTERDRLDLDTLIEETGGPGSVEIRELLRSGRRWSLLGPRGLRIKGLSW
ncbi:MAG TPA: hypothetical protein VK908_03230 [Jiangellales bacterium]|nr:hypothetical protein [Jiangellales bacterium]